MRVFVSFSSADQEVARHLLLDLARHGIDAWDYSRDDERIPASMPVHDGLAERLREVDCVVVLVSHASAAPESRFTQFEVAHALALGLRIVPVHLFDSPPTTLGRAFAELARRELRYVLLASNGAGYERGMSDLCSALGVRYRPRVVAHQRLPLFERFETEIGVLPVKVSNAFFTDMGILAQAFGERYGVSDWRGAHRLIARFCDRLADKWPSVDFYYPGIVKGVCELHLEDFTAAERTFSALLNHALCDENAHTGRGHARFGQRRYDDALSDYTIGAEVARRHGRSDAEIEINRITTLIELGRDVSWSMLNPRLDTVLDQDLAKFRLLRGVALARLRRFQEARGQLEEVTAPQELRAIAVTHLVDVLVALQREATAVNDLTRCLQDTPRDSPHWLPLHHRLAALHTEAGRFEDALPIYRDVLCVDGAMTRQYVTEYARLLTALGDRPAADALYRTVTASTPFGIPTTPHDHYYFGLALFMLGRLDAADVSFQLSDPRYPAYARL